jgi:adenosylcobalamin-dependent ribonucleoside-triphosphate reductase
MDYAVDGDGARYLELYDREKGEPMTEEEAIAVKLAMNMLGVPSAINYNRASKTWWIRFSRSAYENVVRVIFNRKRGHHTKHRAPSWNETVKYVQFVGEEEVYDCQVPGINRYISNGFVSHNCGEIPMMRYPDLKAFDVCCLGHVNLAFAEDPLECFRLMTRFLIRATFAPLPDELTHRNVQRNRRIGVGFLGFHEWLVNHGIKYSQAPQSGWVKRQLRKFREVVIEAARQYASQLRIPEPIKKTTVAPTGTISNIPGTTSGIQPLYAPFYRRRVRYSNSDLELRRVLDRSEYEAVEPALNEPNTTVVSYVCRDIMVDRTSERIGENRALELIESQFDLQVSDFLKVQAMVQREYADNAVSITINVNPQEVSGQQLKELLMLYLPELKGVTIFPEMSRPQSPLERITREEYEAAAFRVAGNYEEDCASGSCPIN